MPIKSAPYFFAKCDNCGARADYGDDLTAYEEPDHAADMALYGDWTRAGERFHCPACPPLDVDETEGGGDG